MAASEAWPTPISKIFCYDIKFCLYLKKNITRQKRDVIFHLAKNHLTYGVCRKRNQFSPMHQSSKHPSFAQACRQRIPVLHWMRHATLPLRDACSVNMADPSLPRSEIERLCNIDDERLWFPWSLRSAAAAAAGAKASIWERQGSVVKYPFPQCRRQRWINGGRLT